MRANPTRTMVWDSNIIAINEWIKLPLIHDVGITDAHKMKLRDATPAPQYTPRNGITESGIANARHARARSQKRLCRGDSPLLDGKWLLDLIGSCESFVTITFPTARSTPTLRGHSPALASVVGHQILRKRFVTTGRNQAFHSLWPRPLPDL